MMFCRLPGCEEVQKWTQDLLKGKGSIEEMECTEWLEMEATNSLY